VSLTAAAWRIRNSVAPKDAIIRPRKCVAKILPLVPWAKIAWWAAVVLAAKFVVELAINVTIRTRQYAAKGTGLCGLARRMLPVAALAVAMMKPQKFAAPILAHAR